MKSLLKEELNAMIGSVYVMSSLTSVRAERCMHKQDLHRPER